MTITRTLAILGAAAALCFAGPALADVKAGVDAWGRGDYARAVNEWRAPAAAGDPDAQFNMAQAYRLGRGVELNAKQAEVLYAKAAAQGHIKAADNYGLLLFQGGRREEAMPYVTAAAERGDPRAQYLIGIAHFNGDLVAKDWVRAYALLTLANGAGLPQAPGAIQQMDGFIPLAQRQAAQTLAQQIKQETDARRAQQLAAADLGLTAAADEPAPRQVAAAIPATTLPPRGASRVPEAIQPATVPPSIAAARAAIAEAQRVTGTESPATAGADFARPATPQARMAAAPRQEQAPAPAPALAPAPPVVRETTSTPVSAPAISTASGPWRVQLGAFGVAGNAERLWTRLAGNAALAGKQKVLVPSGSLTRLLVSGFASKAAAENACSALRSGGQACLVTK
jgi:cell division protein FtsN